MKELKNSLKKESCYTTILTTARIRGVEKVRLMLPGQVLNEAEVWPAPRRVQRHLTLHSLSSFSSSSFSPFSSSPPPSSPPYSPLPPPLPPPPPPHHHHHQPHKVDCGDMTFGLLIAKAQQETELQAVIQNLYLRDEKTSMHTFLLLLLLLFVIIFCCYCLFCSLFVVVVYCCYFLLLLFVLFLVCCCCLLLLLFVLFIVCCLFLLLLLKSIIPPSPPSLEIPVLSSLVIQDHYPVPTTDAMPPLFSVQQGGPRERNIWSQQLDMLYVHKMSEVSRILFTCEMLHSCRSDQGAPSKKRVRGVIVVVPGSTCNIHVYVLHLCA